MTSRWKWSIKQPIIAGRRRKRSSMASSSIADAEVSMNTIEKNLEDIYWRIVKKLESSNKKTENETRILQTKDLFDEDPAQ